MKAAFLIDRSVSAPYAHAVGSPSDAQAPEVLAPGEFERVATGQKTLWGRPWREHNGDKACTYENRELVLS